MVSGHKAGQKDKKSRGYREGMKLLALGSSLLPADVRQETSAELIKPRLPTECSIQGSSHRDVENSKCCLLKASTIVASV